MGRKALSLPGDMRDDLWIIVEMANRLAGWIGLTPIRPKCSLR